MVDPWALLDEIARVAAQGVDITPELLVLADNALPDPRLHRDLDAARELQAGAGKIGTTGRGIGPAYEDKVGRRAIRVADLADRAALETKIGPAAGRTTSRCAAASACPRPTAQALIQSLLEVAPKILPFAQPAWRLLDQVRRDGRRILFEGAQGALLDVDHGTYPFVTSSNTVSGQAAAGSGLGPCAVGFVLGIVKAYTTRVGSGPFPTELEDEVGRRLGERGHEFGTVTGRPRRCGWFDAVLVRQSVRHQRHRRHRPDQARRARRLRRAEDLRRLRARRPAISTISLRPARPGGRAAGLRDHGRLEREHPGRALAGRTCPARP